VRCPFLREEQVKSCQVAPFRKSLARSFATGEGERCTSTDHRACPALRESREAHPDASRCPFLRESLVQFCAASPRPTYVPWSESPDLRCAHDGHRFCEVFLAAAGGSARGPALPTGDADEAATAAVVAAARAATRRFLLVKLTPNVTDITAVARAAVQAGADGLSLVNTFKAMVLDRDTLRPLLGNRTGGLCGPAIKPIALRMVAEVAAELPRVPIVGIEG